MRFIFIVIFGAISLSASAQWYHINLKKINLHFLKKHERYPLIHQPLLTRRSIAQLPPIILNRPTSVQPGHFNRTRYSYSAEEASIIRMAQHNMGSELYTDASHNFSCLGRLYIRQRRFSEAKWYLLQSNNIARRQNDDRLTVSNLIDLAVAKMSIGDYKLAQDDLIEARQIATLCGYSDDLAEIQKRMLYIKQTSFPSPKADIRYVEAP